MKTLKKILISIAIANQYDYSKKENSLRKSGSFFFPVFCFFFFLSNHQHIIPPFQQPYATILSGENKRKISFSITLIYFNCI